MIRRALAGVLRVRRPLLALIVLVLLLVAGYLVHADRAGGSGRPASAGSVPVLVRAD